MISNITLSLSKKEKQWLDIYWQCKYTWAECSCGTQMSKIKISTLQRYIYIQFFTRERVLHCILNDQIVDGEATRSFLFL